MKSDQNYHIEQVIKEHKLELESLKQELKQAKKKPEHTKNISNQ